MSKQAMREEAERLIRETMERKALVVKAGRHTDYDDLRQVRRGEQGLGAKGCRAGVFHLQGVRSRAGHALTLC